MDYHYWNQAKKYTKFINRERLMILIGHVYRRKSDPTIYTGA